MPKSILIVDDKEFVRSALRSLFESMGLIICGETVDGLDAIQKTKELEPDLVVLDFLMPNMNGIEAAKVLKGIRPQLLILMLTAHSSDLNTDEIRQVGIDAVVVKGGNPATLLDTIQTLCKFNFKKKQHKLKSGVRYLNTLSLGIFINASLPG